MLILTMLQRVMSLADPGKPIALEISRLEGIFEP
jgi:hypothetical protein